MLFTIIGSHYYPIHRLKDFNKSNLISNNLNNNLALIYKVTYALVEHKKIGYKSNRKQIENKKKKHMSTMY